MMKFPEEEQWFKIYSIEVLMPKHTIFKSKELILTVYMIDLSSKLSDKSLGAISEF
jgi:hypothetical protein